MNARTQPLATARLHTEPATTVQRLDGTWRAAHDPGNRGKDERWFEAASSATKPVAVPGVVHRAFPFVHGVFWYYHRFVPIVAKPRGQRLLLHFEAVDYAAEVWLNGRCVAWHEGGETPFSGDVSDVLVPEQENLIAVRVLNPYEQRIDGVILKETPHRAKGPDEKFAPGGGYNFGGILGHVELRTVPAVRVDRLTVRADCDSGRVEVIARVVNALAETVDAALRLSVAPAASGQALDDVERRMTIPSGISEAAIALTLAEFRRWDLDDPVLYRARIELNGESSEGPQRSELSDRFGFRDFRLVEGRFHLNGRRRFLKSTHTGNHMPVGYVWPLDSDFMRRDLIMAKACGYDMVRFLCGVPYPEQLDCCDEIGLLVYEECHASWTAIESEAGMARFDKAVREMIERDRNHPCVAIWGLLNECLEKPVFHRAVAALPMIRALDQTRLVLLSSGRWDGRVDIGSISNPGSSTWEHAWGEEKSDAPRAEPGRRWPPCEAHPGGFVEQAGDVHFYPAVPLPERDRQALRTMGSADKPVFLSEFGIGSLFNAIDELRGMARHGLRPEDLESKVIRPMADMFARDLVRFGFDRLYAFPEDFLREGQVRSARVRSWAFDLIRSNPNLCGYNLTGMLDHGFTGEGAWTMDRMFKPAMAEVLQAGWAPLRWCLFAPAMGYAGRPFEIEAVLADEGRLAPGDYSATIRIFSSGRGMVWQQEATVSIPTPSPGRPFAFPVLRTTIASLPAGSYVLAAHLHGGGLPAADRVEFDLYDSIQQVAKAPKLQLIGVGASCEAWLRSHGYPCAPYAPGSSEGIVVIGSGSVPPAVWNSLAADIDRGIRAVFISSAPFKAEVRPFGDEISAHDSVDWIYHKEIVAHADGVFAQLPAGGILDLVAYDRVWSRDLFVCQCLPTRIDAAGFAVGYNCPTGYDSGVVVGSFTRGKGRVVINAMRIEDNVGTHPAADRLLVDLIEAARSAE